MGDDDTHVSIISDDDDCVSVGGDGDPIAGDENFEISDDDQDYMDIAIGERTLWWRGM